MTLCTSVIDLDFFENVNMIFVNLFDIIGNIIITTITEKGCKKANVCL